MNITQISSADNAQFKQLKKLSDSARERRKQGMTLLDGTHLILSAYANQLSLALIILREDSMENAEIQHCLTLFSDTPTVTLSKPLFDSIAPVNTPVGIIALIKIPSHPVTQYQFGVMLENIQDPGNLGSILRTAASAGVEAVFLSKGCAEAWSPKALRAGMGAQFIIHIHENANLASEAGNFQQTYATALDGSESIYNIDLSGSVAFIFGNEGAGLSEKILRNASQRIRIPMPGKTESLNVAAAAAICLFERVRQTQA